MGFKSYNTKQLAVNVLAILLCAAPGALGQISSGGWDESCKDVSGKLLGRDSEPEIDKEGKIEDGLWMPIRLFLYLLGLGYSFYAVGLISDVFMEGIDKITSKKTRKQDPETQRWTTSYAWNATVANLSLMALGSSAPEILLGCIEVAGGNFLLGPLGPGVIVGSAAFNLLCISAVCVNAHEEPKVTYILAAPVYIITATSSVLAYIWLYLIIAQISPDVVEHWEAIVTCIAFPVLLVLAYLADIGKITFGLAETEKKQELTLMEDATKEELAAIEFQIKKEHGQDLTEEQVVGFMKAQYCTRRNKAFYAHAGLQKAFHAKHIDTTYYASGEPEPGSHKDVSKNVETSDDNEGEKHSRTIKIGFDVESYACLESAKVGKFKVTRTGPECKGAITVKYKTAEGSAKKDKHYSPVGEGGIEEGLLTFAPGEDSKEILIDIVNDNAYEEDRDLFVELYDPVCVKDEDKNFVAALGSFPKAKLTIIDDDLPGKFRFKQQEVSVETEVEDKVFHVAVERFDGSGGTIECKYKTESMTAVEGVDYEAAEGKVVMEDGTMSYNIPITIKASGRYLSKASFLVNLSEASCPEGTELAKGKVGFDGNTDGGGEMEVCRVTISGKTNENQDKLLSRMASGLLASKQANQKWKNQFYDAIFTIGDDEEEEGGEDDDPEGGGEKEVSKPGPMDYVFHVAGMPWKLLFAFVPPTDYCGGWPTFVISGMFIGLVTVIVGDLAELLGCALTIPAEITAITFVALGTSLPDTFASKTAAEMDPYADNSIGNVTGSNSVNVFLGCGLAWTLGAIYWAVQPFDYDEAQMKIAYGPTGVLPLPGDGAKPLDYWIYDFNQKTDDQKTNILKIMDCKPNEACKSGSTPFMVPSGSLWFNLVIFASMALIALAHLYARRRKFGGELGGPKGGFLGQRMSGALLASQWLFYIIASSLYCLFGPK
jgi:solute carrier family 8 (sodium/calcium exchanger)